MLALAFSLDTYSGEDMNADFLILGGGIAGLSAANRLAEKGAKVVLLEAGCYPAHKICGEFLSPEALPIIEKWQLPIAATMTTVQFVTPRGGWTMELPQQAASLPRYILDDALAKRAQKKGAIIKTGAQVEHVEQPKSLDSPFTITLKSKEQWLAQTLLVGTGRLVHALHQEKKTDFFYLGVKAHFEGIDVSNQLQMHLLKGAYFGVAPIGEGKVNVAGIIRCTPEEASLAQFFKRPDVRHLKALLSQGQCLFKEWMMAPVPEFGLRHPPLWPRSFFLGDAMGVIPPAAGDGLAMGLTSGILAAEYALKGDPEGYHAHWHKSYARRISVGLWLHRFFLSPALSHTLLSLGALCPALTQYLFRITRGEVLP